MRPENLQKDIVFFPLNIKGHGSGHIRRALSWASELVSAGFNALIVLDDFSGGVLSYKDIQEMIPGFPGAVPVVSFSEYSRSVSAKKRNPAFVVFDRRESSADELYKWPAYSSFIFIDNIGSAAERASFLLDIIPGPRKLEPNARSLKWLYLPESGKRKKITPDNIFSEILVTFGGEDPAGLTLPVISALLECGIKPESVSAAGSLKNNADNQPANRNLPAAAGVKFIGKIDNLKEKLSSFTLIVTSYGITAWEAAAAGTPVLTVDPSVYHARLSRYAGFAGCGNIKIQKV
jgi:spore coat polysaccharide biosynthesis predicted glycosyltransferase SpsG